MKSRQVNEKSSISLKSTLLNLKWWQATIMIVTVLLAAGFAASQGVNVSVNVNLEARVEALENRVDIPVNSTLSAFRKSNSYIVSLVDTYACLQNGSQAKLCDFSTNHSRPIMVGLGNASLNGGSVYIAEGSYSASIILKNNTRLVIDDGAKGITISGVDPSASCIVDDFNSGSFRYYANGLLYSQFDYVHGNLLTVSANLTTIYVNTIDSITGNVVKILRLIVENGTSFPSGPSVGYLFFRKDWSTLCVYDGSVWVNCSGGGGAGPDLSMYLLQNGSRPLTADWNVGGYGIYGVTWLNTTNINLNGGNIYFNQGQAVNMTFWKGTSFPENSVAGQPFFRTDLNGLYVYNGTAWLQSSGSGDGGGGAIIINRAKGLTDVGLSNWGTPPSNLQYATDEDYSTRTTMGTTLVNGSATTYGTMMYDLGQIYDRIEVSMKIMFGNTIAGGAYGRVYVEIGDNNSVTLRTGGYHSCVCEEWVQDADQIQWAHAMGSGRYILIGWYASASTGTWRGAMYEFKVWQSINGTQPVLPFGYLVYKSGSTYYMEDSVGNLDYSSTDFSSVTNSALGNTSKGSYVYLKGATTTPDYYWITSTIYVPDQVGLRVEGWDYDSTILASASDIDYIWLCGEASWIENVYLESTQTSFSHTMLTVNGSFCNVNHIHMVRGGSKAMGGTGLKVVAGSVIYSTFNQIAIQGNFTNGVVLENSLTFSGYYINQNEFRNIQVGLSDYGYHYGYILNKTNTGDMYGNTFYGCTIDLGFNGTYIYINNAASTQFFDFKTWDTFTGATLLNIVDADTTNTRFFGGLLSYNISPNIINNGVRTVFDHVVGLVTQNYVIATNTTAVTFTFNHGCSIQPNIVHASFNTKNVLGYEWSVTPTQVTITISWNATVGTLPATMECYAECIYDPSIGE
jgi:hypothetical protein